MIKSFSGQVAFSFAILRVISAYVGENRLSQYSLNILDWYIFSAKNQSADKSQLCIFITHSRGSDALLYSLHVLSL